MRRNTEQRERAKYGAAAFECFKGSLPNPFPRTMGPNCAKYVQEVVERGLTVDMMGRFERAFAAATGVKHCIATPGCTPALAALAAAFSFKPGDEIIVSARSPITARSRVWCARTTFPSLPTPSPVSST